MGSVRNRSVKQEQEAGVPPAPLSAQRQRAPLVALPMQTSRLQPLPHGSALKVMPKAPLTSMPKLRLRAEPKAAIVVKPPCRFIWEDRGWSRDPSRTSPEYFGEYKAIDEKTGRERHFAGWLCETQTEIEAYIHEPPLADLRRHRRGGCFHPTVTGDGWYQIHWQVPPRHPDDALLSMETILYEAINHSR